MSVPQIKSKIKSLASVKKAKTLKSFFKTNPGDYAEGDKFVGIGMAQLRKIAIEFYPLNFNEISELLSSKYHETRMIGVLSLVFLFEKKESKVTKSQVYRYYIKHAKKINNWDFVDVSAHKIVGRYIDQQPEEKKILQQLAQSNNLWERRISIVSTLYLIKKGDFKETIRIAKILLNDEHDLIHKAVGWMLREVGKQSEETLVSFLDKHALNLSRTSLRYSIERLPKEMKSHYMKIK